MRIKIIRHNLPDETKLNKKQNKIEYNNSNDRKMRNRNKTAGVIQVSIITSNRRGAKSSLDEVAVLACKICILTQRAY